jgi:hypothetical protein
MLQRGCRQMGEDAETTYEKLGEQVKKNTALAAWRHLPFFWPACLLFFFLFQTYSVMATISFFFCFGKRRLAK